MTVLLDVLVRWEPVAEPDVKETVEEPYQAVHCVQDMPYVCNKLSRDNCQVVEPLEPNATHAACCETVSVATFGLGGMNLITDAVVLGLSGMSRPRTGHAVRPAAACSKPNEAPG